MPAHDWTAQYDGADLSPPVDAPVALTLHNAHAADEATEADEPRCAECGEELELVEADEAGGEEWRDPDTGELWDHAYTRDGHAPRGELIELDPAHWAQSAGVTLNDDRIVAWVRTGTGSEGPTFALEIWRGQDGALRVGLPELGDDAESLFDGEGGAYRIHDPEWNGTRYREGEQQR